MTGKKSPSNGSKVQTIVERKPIVEYLLSSGGMYLFTLIFSIFGIVFIVDQIPNLAKILLGIVFAVPILIIVFQKGKTAGEKEYKLKNKTVLSDIHSQRIEKVNIFKSILHTVFFVVSAVLLTVLGVAAKQQWLQGVMLIIFIPTTLIFQGAGLIKFELGFVTWYSVLSVAIFVFLVAVVFIIGYIYNVNALKRRSSEIVNEIRSYE